MSSVQPQHASVEERSSCGFLRLSAPGPLGRATRRSIRTPHSAFRTLLLPLLCATLGFSYALATANISSRNINETPRAGSRAVGQDLRFTHPFIGSSTPTDPIFPSGGDETDDPDGFDLGDAMVGSSILRYISAAGGFKPYNFELRPLLNSNNLGGGNQPPQFPPLTPAGKFSGNMPAQIGGVFTYFNVQLTDFVGTQRLGTFRLNVIQPNAPFRFAHDTLPTAQQGHSYFTNIPVLGGQAPVNFSLLAGSVVNGSKSFATLEEIGLALSSDGIVSGRPLVAGVVTFTVRAADGRNVAALNRGATGVDQRFTLNVETLKSAQSELLGLQCTIKGNQPALNLFGRDSFNFSGIVDTKGLEPASLAGTELGLRIGAALFTGQWDERGRISVALPNKGKFTANLALRGGKLKIKLTNVDLAAAVNAANIAGDGTLNVVVSLDLPNFRATEVLTMASRVRNGKYSLSYALGRLGAPAAGAFQIVDIKGIEGRSPDKIFGNRFVVRFYGVPRSGIDGKAAADVISAAGNVTIRIGYEFSQAVNVTDKVVRKEFKATSADPGVFRLLLDPKKFLHRLETNTLLQGDTGIVPAIETKDATIFQLGMDITDLNGDTGRVIVPNGKSWSHR